VGEGPEWTLADYVLNGRYCEIRVIDAELEAVRRYLDADLVILIAFRNETLFHSLLRAAHRDPAQNPVFNRLMADIRYLARDDEPPFLVYDPVRHGPSWLLNELAKREGFADLRRHFDRPRLLSRSARLTETAARSHPPPASMHLLINGGKAGGSLELDEHLDAMLTMVNASAPVVVHGNLEAEKEVHRELAQRDRKGSADAVPASKSSGRSAPEDLLKAGLALTGSSAGSIYFDTRKGQQLKLAAEEGEIAYSERIDITDKRSVAWVYGRRRPMVINDAGDFDRLHPDDRTGRSQDGVQPYATLAVPILQSDAGPNAVVGVFSVEKVDPGDEGYYTYRDLVIVRMLASRVGLWRAQELLSRFSRSLTTLTHRNTASAAVIEVPEREGDHDEVPADALTARDTISAIVKSMYELTRSHSVTARLLDPQKRHLVRFCAHPPERLYDEHASLLVRNAHSINAWVARNGEPCYIPNVKVRNASAPYPGLSGQLQVREETYSELCLPIVVGGRLVGTFNMESPYRDGYSGSTDIALAVAGQVALSLEQARRAQEQTVFSMTAATAANTHHLLKYVDQLRGAPQDRETMERIADGINLCVDTGAEMQEEDPASTPEIVRKAFEEVNVDHLTVWRNEPPVVIQHPGRDAAVLRTVFGELIRNAHAAAMQTRKLRFSVKYQQTKIGGRRFLSILLGNPIRRRVPEAEQNLLFHAPVRRPFGRVHIGAFAAAALVRSIGGDVYVDLHRPPDFVVAVDLPVPESLGQPTSEEV